MPLLDHFRPPLLYPPWTSVPGAWATTLAGRLNRGGMPARLNAVPLAKLGGGVEIDVAAVREFDAEWPGPRTGWSPPSARAVAELEAPGGDTFEVQVFYDDGERTLVAAVELVSPGNKDRPSAIAAFASKCAAYLLGRVSVAVVDVATVRHGDLHAAILREMNLSPGELLPRPAPLFAASYRGVTEADRLRLEIWAEPLAAGAAIPTIPLWLGPDLAVPLELESADVEALEMLGVRP